MFLEYWRNPEATAAKFRGDWLMTGDQGSLDDEGYLHFLGRDDDVITSGGYRIGPGEIEDCLLKHPAVAMAAAVGVPDPVRTRSEEHTSELQSLMRISYAVFCLTKKTSKHFI